MAGLVRRLAAAWLVCGIALAGATQAQGQDDLARLRAEINRLFGQGKHADAVPIAQRYVELARQKHGEAHPEFVTGIVWLAFAYQAQGRLAEAEPLHRRSLDILEKALGPDHPNVGTSLINLADLYVAQGRLADAEPLYRRGLAIREKKLGPEHPLLGTPLNDLAMLYLDERRLEEAEPHFRRSLAIREKALGVEHPDVAQSLNNLAGLYQAQGRLAEAEPLFVRGLAICEKALGGKHPCVGTLLTNLALLNQAVGRFMEAEPLFKRGLAIREKALGPEHPDVAEPLDNLAALYLRQNRLAEAEPLVRRSLAIREKVLGPEHPGMATSLHNLAELYREQGRLAEAEPLHKRSLAIREKALGPEHPHVGISLNNLAGLYQALGRRAEAEPLYQRALAINEKVLGPQHPEVALSLANLAVLYHNQGRRAEAEPLYRRSLTIRENVLGPDHPEVGRVLSNLARLYEDQGRYAEAEPLHRRSLAIREKALGPEHLDVGISLNTLAALYQAQGRLVEAETLYRRSLGIREKVLGAEHPDVGTSLNDLGGLYQAQGRYADAETLYRRSLAIREKTLGPEHPDVGTSLNMLALLYQVQGRLTEAEPLFRRSLAVREKVLGPERLEVSQSLNNLALLYYRAQQLGQTSRHLAEAEPLYRRALAINEKALGPEHPLVGKSLSNLAELYRVQGRLTEAEPLFRRSLAIREKALGPEHADVALSLSNLALLYRDQGRPLAEAGELLRRSLAIREKALGPEHPDVAQALGNLASYALTQRDWAQAADYWRRGTGVIVRRGELGLSGGVEGSIKGEAQRLSWYFVGLVKAIHRLAAEGRAPGTPAAEMFETAQWAQASEAAASLAQMAVRAATGSPELAGLVRERQDLVGEWQAKDELLIAAKSQEPGKRNAGAEQVLADRLGAIDARLTNIGRTLARDFPDYAALASAKPVSAADVQAQLGTDEALVLFLDTDDRFKPLPEETFVWVVTRSEVRWVRSELGTAALKREVAALRCALDGTLWDDKHRRARCAELLKAQRSGDRADAPAFPVARAHALYKALLGEVEDLIKGKHLLIVPSGALTQLPFQVLVTAPPVVGVRPGGADPKAQPSVSGGSDGKGKGGDMGSEPQGLTPYREAAWLGARHPITVLPAVSSLKALRAHARASRAGKVYLGVGNPLLDGRDARFAKLAKRARASKSCPVARSSAATLETGQGGVAPVEIRGGLANVADLRMQAPLPETAEELCAVAHDLKADVNEVRLGDRATETEIKRLSRSGELARYRVLHFATHGAMAGELGKDREPGLILTPPEKASEEDDGYLSASEIASLKLDADWVILSACNTAAGGASSAEALSGVARAFIYAGGRALLVSHWAVDSNAAVKLITTAAAEMARDPSAGRAEAMRRAMLALIDKGRPEEVHPAYWAPFIVVGEGAPGR